MKETGCAAVKLEGGEAMAATIEFLTHRGIPVIGHVGLTPQAVNVLGGYGARGREEREAGKIIADARAVDHAGAFCIVVEGVLEEIADDITGSVAAPVIGIGASAQCDGQVLVTDDMLGMFERTPRFVKRYDDLATRIGDAARSYAEEVRARTFPTADRDLQAEALNSFAFGAAIARRSAASFRSSWVGKGSDRHVDPRPSGLRQFWRSPLTLAKPSCARSMRTCAAISCAISSRPTAIG